MSKLWTIQDWKTAYLTQKIQLSDLIQYVKTFNNDDHAWIEIASAAHIQAQIAALKDLLKNQADVIREVANTIHRSSKDKYAQRR